MNPVKSKLSDPDAWFILELLRHPDIAQFENSQEFRTERLETMFGPILY